MPKALRRYLPSLTVGFGLSGVLVTVMVGLGLGGLTGFDLRSTLYFAALGVIFSLIQFHFRRYLAAREDVDGPGGRGPRGGLRDLRPIPVRVPAVKRKSGQAPRHGSGRNPRG